MTEAIIVALITGVCSVIGTCVLNHKNSALVAYRIEQLEKKVDTHNNYAKHIPTMENDIKNIYKRLELLERK